MTQSFGNRQTIRKIFDRLKNNERRLKTNHQTFLNLHFEEFVKSPIIDLYISDWNTIQIAQANLSTQYRPIAQFTNTVPVSHKAIIEPLLTDEFLCPEEWLGFINVTFEVKTIPDTSVIGIDSYNRKTFIQNQQILVDGDEIYSGIGRSNRFLYNQTHIDSGEVHLEHLKQAWFVSKTDLSDSGRVTKIVIRYDTTSSASPCGANNDFKELVIDLNTFQLHEITALTNSSVTGYGLRSQHTFVNLPPCTEQVTTISEGVTTQSFSGVTSVTITIERTNGSTFNVSAIAPVNQDQDVDYWLYFGDLKTPPRVGFQTVSGDERLLAVPPDSYNIGTIEVIPFAKEVNTTTLNVSDNRHGFLKVSKSNDEIERWKLRFGGTAGLVISGLPLFVGQVDIISVNERKNTYTNPYSLGPTQSDVDVLKDFYRLPDQDVQWRIKLTLKNPLYNKI